MAKIGLTQAARLTGKDPSTIARRSNHKDVTKRLSFEVNESGDRLYDVAELERVFGVLRNPDAQEDGNSADSLQRNDVQVALQEAKDRENALLREQIGLLQEQLDATNEDRDHWRQQATYLLEDKSKKESILGEHLATEQELREKLAQEKAQQEQIENRMAEMQSSLDKVRNSWLGRLLFKV